jgi:hypothetical protein
VSQTWAKGSTRAWRRTRAVVLLRDGYRCRLQLGVCTGVATCVHHTLGRAVTGDHLAFLVASCAPCNLHIGDPQRHADPPNQPVTRW